MRKNKKKTKTICYNVTAEEPMKNIFLFVFCLFGLSACVVVPQTKVSQTNSKVKIVTQKPQGCQFLAGVLGDQNDVSGQWSQDMLANIRNNAANLGGNVVYLRSAAVAPAGASEEYFRDFYVDGVRYGGLIYKCP